MSLGGGGDGGGEKERGSLSIDVVTCGVVLYVTFFRGK